MTSALKVFVSSVQKELEDERLIVHNLISTDTFLSYRDLKGLAVLMILTRQGLGRSAKYILREPESKP